MGWRNTQISGGIAQSGSRSWSPKAVNVISPVIARFFEPELKTADVERVGMLFGKCLE